MSEYVSYAVPISAEMAEDAERMQQWVACSFFLMTFDSPNLTDEELRIGQRVIPHGDHEHTVSVGWRAEQEQRENDARIEIEKAACAYVACTCGHHEDD